jgi:hypothetical protein
MAKTNETTAVAKAKASALPADLLGAMEADKGERQQFDSSQLIIPRINILQDLSPQVKKSNAAHVEGAEPGQFFNNVAGTLDRMITFVPASFHVRYIAWKPRKQGGGLVDQNLTLEEVEQNFEADGIGRWIGQMSPGRGEPAVNVEVIESPEWVGMAMSENWGWMPVAISFPGTKAKSARKMNTAIEMTEVEGANGPFTPPAFYHTFELSSVLEQSGDDSWFGFQVSHLGLGKTPKHIVEKAKALKKSLQSGEAAVADAE